MRLATAMVEGAVCWGVVRDDLFVPVEGGSGSIVRAIARGSLEREAESASGAPVPTGSLQWRPVVPDAQKIICVGLNYEDHRKETGRAVVQHPTIFTRYADTQIGHREPMRLPKVSDRLDYEGELAIVIGKAGRYIPRDAALSHVAGYSCYNDGSIRDWQRHTTQFTPGKNFPGTGAFGPWLVTPDEFGSASGKRLRTRLNDEIMQDAALDEMIFDIPTLIEYVSGFTPLAPGDVIVTGTPGGVGAMRDPPVFMKEGDVIEIEIDGIGVLSNPIGREA